MGLTVCLLNYKRPENLPSLFASLRSQTLLPKIFLWNNGQWEDIPDLCRRHIDWLLESSHNAGCRPRWWMAAQADTEYVCSLDDDQALADPRVLADAIDLFANVPGCRAVGRSGVLFTQPKYWDCQHILAEQLAPSYDFQRVDYVKGRFLLTRRDWLREAALPAYNGELAMDDLEVCGRLSSGQAAQHAVLRGLAHRFVELPAAHAASEQPGFPAQKVLARQKYFPNSLPSFYGA